MDEDKNKAIVFEFPEETKEVFNAFGLFDIHFENEDTPDETK